MRPAATSIRLSYLNYWSTDNPLINVQWISTDQNKADIGTKVLTQGSFAALRDALYHTEGVATKK
jgi:hypothetical protein